MLLARKSLRRAPCHPTISQLLTIVNTTDVFTAGTAMLAILLSPDTQRLLPERDDSLGVAWTRVMEVFAVYEQQGCRFAKRCAKMLQRSLDQHRGGVERPMNGKGLWTPEADCEALQAVSPPKDHVADDLRNEWTIPDDWWQAAGMGWLNDLDTSLT